MNKARYLKLFSVLALVPAFVHADYRTAAFPPAHELFAPLQADPTELQFSFTVGAPVSNRGVTHVAIGDYMGIYRWAFPDKLGAAQLNVGGGIFNRFSTGGGHTLQVIDYYGNVPLDFRLGPVSGRFMFYHDSSHLGDDYLREKDIEGANASWEALRGLLSIQPWRTFRFYGGYNHALRSTPDWRGNSAIQAGVEYYIITKAHVFLHPYLATDFQSWHRSGWKPTWTVQLGVKTGSEKTRGRGISYFVQCQTGSRLEGQFFTQTETLWSGGLKFQISQALISPGFQPETPTP